jgi:MFS family permease
VRIAAKRGPERLLPPERQQRAFAVATLVNMTGSGLWVASSALFATRVLHLGIVEAGAALTVAAVIGQLAGLPAGYVADRYGARATYAATKLLGAIGMASLVIVHGVIPFAAVCCVIAALSAASAAARTPLVRALGGERPVQFRAYLRSVSNLGLAVGASLAGVATQLDNPVAYLGLILTNSISSLLCAVLVWVAIRDVAIAKSATQAESAAPTAHHHHSRSALADKRFVWLTTINGLFSIHSAMLSFALPLWVVGHTSAPPGLVGALIVVNTGLVVVLQVRFSSSVHSSRAALAMLPKAGLAFLVMAAGVVAAAAVNGWVAAAVVMLSVIAYTAGELWHATAAYELMFRYSPPQAQGQYAGLFNLGQGLADAAGPLVLGVVCLGWGAPGWLAIGVALAGLGAAAPLSVGHRGRHRIAAPRSLSTSGSPMPHYSARNLSTANTVITGSLP